MTQAGGAVAAGAARADDARALGSMASVSLSEAEKVYIVHGVQVAAAAAWVPAAGAPGPAGGAGARFARVDRKALGFPCGLNSLKAGGAGVRRSGRRTSFQG